MHDDERNATIKVMVNRTHRGKLSGDAGRDAWRRFNATFTEEETTAHGLAKLIYSGFAFAPVYDGRRRRENFRGAWHIALDFDTEDAQSSLETLSNDEFAWLFASFGYTTPSHTPEKPKARLVFIFPYSEPITDPEEYDELYRAMLWRFPAADRATKDPVRLFFGSHLCDVWPNWSIFPAAARQVVIDQYRQHLAETRPAQVEPRALLKVSGQHAAYVSGAVTYWTDRVASAAAGERHHELWKAGRSLGGFVSAPWADLAEEDAAQQLIAAASWARGERDQAEAERVIRDGISRGKAEPHDEPSIRVSAAEELLPPGARLVAGLR